MDVNLLIATIAVTVAGLVGIFTAPVLAKRQGVADLCTAFAAGVLLVIVLAHVVPHALEKGKVGVALIMIGFIGMMILQRKVLKADPCCGHEHAKHAGLPSYLALAACSINDGLITQHEVADHMHGNSIWTHPILWAMCGHKLTASFALVMLLRETSAGLAAGVRMIYMLVFVAITPAVILLSSTLEFLKEPMPYVVACGAGALMYVIFGGMIPRVEHLAQDGRNRVLVVFLIAVALTMGVELSHTHSHAH